MAMLLVMAAPVVSRALAHPAMPPVQALVAGPQVPAAHHMHHDMGHGMGHDMASHADHPRPASPHAEHDMGVECDYCLIAARMISLLVAVLLLMTLWPAVFRALAGFIDTRRAPAAGTLGARGPPALVC
nr:DUF2946 family protein [Stenotrophomonas tumulicola]